MTMKALTTKSFLDIRCIIFGGEGYPKPELLKLYTLFSNQSQLINVYGPTECTCICSAYRITEKDFDEINGLPPLGELNPNFDYYILDEQGDEANTGEICLIGPNVASGYYNDKFLTDKSFTTLCDKKRFMKRMYRTGDIVSRKDGLLWYIGRVDNQIKHMGYRIELEEIENAIVQHKDVNQAAVIYMRSQTTHGKIIAFVASRKLIEETDIIEKTRQLLPAFMVPSKVKFLKSLPKNQNGKIDRIELHNLI
jgi:D-alanine--poly(phosphoribitol) ligase subunit 1